MLTPCPTDDRKMQLFANFVLVFLKMSGFCNTLSLRFFKFFVFPSTIHLARTKGKQTVVSSRLSLFEAQAFALVKSVANVFYVVGNGLSTFVTVFKFFVFTSTIHLARTKGKQTVVSLRLFIV